MKALRADHIERMLEILTGEVASPALSRSLLDRTGGDPTRVLAHLMDLLDREYAAPVEPREDLEVHPRGEFWSISWGGKTVHLRDGRGVRYLAELAGRPGMRLASATLVASLQGAAVPPPSREHARLAVTKAMKRVWHRLDTLHPALAAHLAATLHCGYSCVYSPERRRNGNGHTRLSISLPLPDPDEFSQAMWAPI